MMRSLALGLWLIGAQPCLAQDWEGPAELPPATYAGQQYVDSKGCLFLRAGQPGRVTWVPRVTRDGMPICGYPPSGRRVPVVTEGAATAEPAPTAPAPADVASGGYFVAVGSFGVAANADKAIARLKLLNYPVARGKISPGASLVTVFAGPFTSGEDAARARAELQGLGFPDAMVVGP